MTAEVKWNYKTIKLAFQFMSFDDANVSTLSVLMDSNEDTRENSLAQAMLPMKKSPKRDNRKRTQSNASPMSMTRMTNTTENSREAAETPS